MQEMTKSVKMHVDIRKKDYVKTALNQIFQQKNQILTMR